LSVSYMSPTKYLRRQARREPDSVSVLQDRHEARAASSSVDHREPGRLPGAHARRGARIRKTGARGGPIAGGRMFVGIDVAKASVVVAVHPTGETWTVGTTGRELRALAQRLAKLGPTLIVLEA